MAALNEMIGSLGRLYVTGTQALNRRLYELPWMRDLESPRPLYHWPVRNFGDQLFGLICAQMLGARLKTCRADYRGAKLLAGGSILHVARHGDTIWGVGLHDPDRYRHPFSELDVRAVRGPLTHRFLKEQKKIRCPEVFGDPGLLVPRLFPDLRRVPVRNRVGLVPHLQDITSLSAEGADLFVIRPDREPLQVIQDILSCEKVISSSLHGLVIAEVFGIEARWLHTGGKEPALKFHDYHESTGRRVRPAANLAEARAQTDPPIRSTGFSALWEAFPRDLTFAHA